MATQLFNISKVAQRMWEECDKWIGITIFRHERLDVNLQSFNLAWLNTKQNRAWKGVWIAIVYELWNQGNKIVFRNGIVDSSEVSTMEELDMVKT